MNILNQIKNIVILLVMAVVSVFVWKTKSENESLKEDLSEVKKDIEVNSLKEDIEVVNNKLEVKDKETETTVKVVEELSNAKVEDKLEGHKDGKTFNITV